MDVDEPLYPGHQWHGCLPHLHYAYRGTVAASSRYGWFAPPWYSCWLVHQGGATVRFRDTGSWYAGPGHWLLLPPTLPRHQDISPETDLCSIAVSLPLPVSHADPPLPQRVSAAATPQLVAAADRLLACQGGRRGSPGRQGMAWSLSQWLALQAALLIFLQAWWDQLQSRNSTVARPLDSRVVLARQLLARHPRMGPIDYQALGAACGLGRVQLDRLFKAQLGRSPRQERDQHLLQAVLVDLDDPHLGLEALAQRHGFTDSSHLCRWFRRALGTSPGQYRRQTSDRDAAYMLRR